MKYTIKIILIITFCFNLTKTLAQVNDWVLKKDKQGVEVYTREDKLTGLIEFKATTIFQASIDTILNVFRNVEGYSEWMADTKISLTLKQINEFESYIYFEAQVPWPLENRDILLYQKIKKTDDETIISLTGKPDYIPKKKGITRIEKASGSWEFITLPRNKVKVTYTFLADPGLNIPKWIINLFIVDGPSKTLLNLKEIVED